jgi:two-component system CAI-1 autoinducer sensor kinase/phosphatase CqsS
MLELTEPQRLKPSKLARATDGALAIVAHVRAGAGKWVRECARRYVEYHAHAERKILAAAVIGVIGFPLFYLVWAYVMPQPYENLSLRLSGAALCALLAAGKWWPMPARKYLAPLAYVTFLYSLPFFFTLMLLFNHSNPAWQMSTLAALIYVVLLYDLLNAIVVVIVGSLAAIAAYLVVTHGAPIPDGYWMTLPILSFALTGFFGLAYGDNLIAREKLKAAASLASQVAHECRTPLTGIRFEAEGCQRLLAKLPASRERDKLVASHHRVRQHITSANSVIDLLLSNVAQHHRGAPTIELHRMSKIVAMALDRYHFKPNQRELVRADVEEDFEFRGSDVLMTHVLFNLMKNGLRAMEARGGDEGCFSIELRRGRKANKVIVRDTGEGISPDFVNYVFIPFVSAQRPGVGTGLGLSFCRMIVEGCGGTISCRSQVNVGTTFTIELPVVQPVDYEAPGR